ncbi:MAG: hypothetical protein HYW47_02550 [Deltaproteobacteria bacterium]|nr:hypothetical protein [Deltaproteobacteria bacterium]
MAKIALFVGIFLFGSLSLSYAQVFVVSPHEAASRQIYELNKRLLQGEDQKKIREEFEYLISYWQERGISPQFLASRWNAAQVTFGSLVFEHYKAALYYTDGSRDNEIEYSHRRFLKRLGIDPDQLNSFSRDSHLFKTYKQRLDALKKHEEVIQKTAKLIQSRNLWDYLEAENDIERIEIQGLLDVDLSWARKNALKAGVPLELLGEREKALLHFYKTALDGEISTLETVTGGVALAPLVPVSMALAPVLFGITASQSAALAAIPMGIMGTKGIATFFIRSSFNSDYFNGSNLYSDLLGNLVSSIPYAVASPLIGGGISRMMVSESAAVSKGGHGIFYSLLGLGALNGAKNAILGGNQIYEGNAEQGTLLIADGAIDIVTAGLLFKYGRVQKEPEALPETKTFNPNPSHDYPVDGKPEHPFEFNPRGWQENYLPPEQSWRGDFNSSPNTFNKLHNPFSELEILPETMTRTTLPEIAQKFHVLNKPVEGHNTLTSPLPTSHPIWTGVMSEDDNKDTELREIVRRDRNGNIIGRQYIRVKKGLSSDEIFRFYGLQLGLTSLDEIVGPTYSSDFSIMNTPQASNGSGESVQGNTGGSEEEDRDNVEEVFFSWFRKHSFDREGEFAQLLDNITLRLERDYHTREFKSTGSPSLDLIGMFQDMYDKTYRPTFETYKNPTKFSFSYQFFVTSYDSPDIRCFPDSLPAELQLLRILLSLVPETEIQRLRENDFSMVAHILKNIKDKRRQRSEPIFITDDIFFYVFDERGYTGFAISSKSKVTPILRHNLPNPLQTFVRVAKFLLFKDSDFLLAVPNIDVPESYQPAKDWHGPFHFFRNKKEFNVFSYIVYKMGFSLDEMRQYSAANGIYRWAQMILNQYSKTGATKKSKNFLVKKGAFRDGQFVPELTFENLPQVTLYRGTMASIDALASILAMHWERYIEPFSDEGARTHKRAGYAPYCQPEEKSWTIELPVALYYSKSKLPQWPHARKKPAYAFIITAKVPPNRVWKVQLVPLIARYSADFEYIPKYVLPEEIMSITILLSQEVQIEIPGEFLRNHDKEGVRNLLQAAEMPSEDIEILLEAF